MSIYLLGQENNLKKKKGKYFSQELSFIFSYRFLVYQVAFAYHGILNFLFISLFFSPNACNYTASSFYIRNK